MLTFPFFFFPFLAQADRLKVQLRDAETAFTRVQVIRHEREGDQKPLEAGTNPLP